MTEIIAKSSEKDINKPKKNLLYKIKRQGQNSEHAVTKINFTEAGKAIAKKRGLMIPEKDSAEMTEEEAALVNIAVKSMIEEIKSGKRKTHKLEDVLEEQRRKRGLR